ncbi:MAG: Clp protease N-terminal domain-containing protein [Microthrixaceae bacterium]
MALDPNTWTLKTQEAVNSAVSAATAAENPEVTPDHLVVALLSQDSGVVLPVVRKIGIDPVSLRNRAADAVGALAHSYGTKTSISKDLTDVLSKADAERTSMGDDYLSTEHLLLALVAVDESLPPPVAAFPRSTGTSSSPRCRR